MALKGDKKGIGFKYALQGLGTIFKRERNFRIQILALFIVIIAGLVFKLSPIEWAIILIVSSLVLAFETINSIIELMIDYLKPEIHPIAKKIKDMSAGTVLIVAIAATIIGLLIFGRRILLLL